MSKKIRILCLLLSLSLILTFLASCGDTSDEEESISSEPSTTIVELEEETPDNSMFIGTWVSNEDKFNDEEDKENADLENEEENDENNTESANKSDEIKAEPSDEENDPSKYSEYDIDTEEQEENSEEDDWYIELDISDDDSVIVQKISSDENVLIWDGTVETVSTDVTIPNLIAERNDLDEYDDADNDDKYYDADNDNDNKDEGKTFGETSADTESMAETQDDLVEMVCDRDEMRFMYQEDGRIFFYYDDETDSNLGTYVSKISDEPMITSIDDIGINEENETDLANDEDNIDDELDVEEDENVIIEESQIDDEEEDVQESQSLDDENNSETETENSEYVDQSTCAHAYGVGVVTTPATCTENGIRTFTCSKCGLIRTSPIPATGHNYESKITTSATCGTNGTRTYTCTSCGDTYSTTIPATGNHSWQDIVESVYVPEQGHYQTVSSVYTVYICSECGGEETSAESMKNHINLIHNGNATYTESTATKDINEYIVDTEAHYEDQVTGAKCSVCGATK